MPGEVSSLRTGGPRGGTLLGVPALLQDPVVLRRNRIALDWDNAWSLDTGGSVALGDEAIDISIRFAAPIPLRPVRLVAEGFGLSRAEVERLVVDGTLVSAVRLTGKRSSDFSFTLKGGAPVEPHLGHV